MCSQTPSQNGQDRDCAPAYRRSAASESLQHPCFSEEAAQHAARLHLPVAPACNLQCRYCHRRFDCSNESRPGVVSQLMTPEEALRHTQAVAARLPQLRVVGIAGPGDPLANLPRVLATCELIQHHFPELQLCLSTNGLALPEALRSLLRLQIRHFTITINTLDPHVGAEIYSWLFWKQRRRRGLEAARILLEQQLSGLHSLVAHGCLVKINTVLIPGVNDTQISAINHRVSEAGAFSHNIMPLLSQPEHGSYYGVMGIRGADEAQLQAARASCSGSIRLMRHCQQCRADAVGMLMPRQAIPIQSLPLSATASPRLARMG
ncbi:nitrogenase cofactor biosynthesis protein NifB [Candidatus Magnetaquicoccus inordinatus]|uniref:nitrogenase cofactor biosynthesis protein NifB n=1 Tax=Candidatus Magnetaquicoccus inordinatus TaxID=2496818 RepID=UPI00102B4FAF|nr:nitrogenase cofactor biosynthesis protein NifB [Candidatus Magnetaquicoccus inordinatus]